MEQRPFDQKSEVQKCEGVWDAVDRRAWDYWVYVCSFTLKIFIWKKISLSSLTSLSRSLTSLSVRCRRRTAGGGATVFSGEPHRKTPKSKLFTVNPHYFTCSFQIPNLKIKKTHQSTGSEEKFGNLFFVSVSVCGYRMGCCLLMFWVWKLWLCVYLKMDFEWWLWRWYFDERLKMKIAALLCCLYFCIFLLLFSSLSLIFGFNL
jgi:hypothetical protein